MIAWGSHEVLTIGGLLAGGYLCGAIPFGLIIGRLRGVDIRTKGSGNIGATNVGRVLGKRWGILAFALDVLKGLGPTLIAGRVLDRTLTPNSASGLSSIGLAIWVLVAGACILGHVAPVYLKFKGGKGVATALGALLGIHPYFTYAGLAAFALWGGLVRCTRYVSVGSMGAAVAFPVIFTLLAFVRRESWGGFEVLWPLHLFCVVIALLVVYRHRSNLRRLVAGTEPKIGEAGRPREVEAS